jgi:hypothetical protein
MLLHPFALLVWVCKGGDYSHLDFALFVSPDQLLEALIFVVDVLLHGDMVEADCFESRLYRHRSSGRHAGMSYFPLLVSSFVGRAGESVLLIRIWKIIARTRKDKIYGRHACHSTPPMR